MISLFAFSYEGSNFEVVGSNWNGLEILLRDGQELARRRNFGNSGEYTFHDSKLGELALTFHIAWQDRKVAFELKRNGAPVVNGAEELKIPLGSESQPAAETGAATAASARPSGHSVAWLGIALKLFQSGKFLKVALAAVAVSGWTVLYSWQFALALTATIVFHEYGHLRAMRRFGIKTSGLYLIPFFGGLAVGERAKTHWQDVYIAMMGPMFGLLMAAVGWGVFVATSNHFIGLVASLSALINIFNLIPVYPLDGGRVVKALVFSGRSRLAFGLLFVTSAAAFAAFFYWQIYLLCFFLVIGIIDLLASWRAIASDPKPPLDRNGIAVSLGWYLLAVIAFLGIIVTIANSGVPGSEVAVKVLQS